MKRFLALTTALILSLLMATSAFAAEDAYTLYRKSMKEFEKAASVGYQGNVKMTMDIAGESVSVDSNFVIRMVNKEDGVPDMEMEMFADGESTYMYFKDGALYMPLSDDTKVMVPAVASDMVSLFDEDGKLEDMEKDMFENAVVETTESGGTRIRFSMKSDDIMDVANEVYEGMDLDAEITEISRLSYSILLDKDGNFKSMKMYMDAAIKAEDEEATFQSEVDLKVISVNQYRQIYFPSDINLYTKTSIF